MTAPRLKGIDIGGPLAGAEAVASAGAPKTFNASAMLVRSRKFGLERQVSRSRGPGAREALLTSAGD